MIHRFSQYLVEEAKTVYFTFGRMNPPTIGHGKLLDKLATVAGRNPYKIYLSQTADKNKNPLDYTAKVKHVRKMFPKHARQVMINKKVRTVIEALTALYEDGFRNAVLVVGSDRVQEFDILLNKYNGQRARHGFYNFESIKVVSAGDRDPDADDASGASATKQRAAASSNDFTQFSQGVPNTMSNADTRRLFNDVRKGMGLKEEKEFKRHIQLAPVSELRESYVNKKLFDLGEQVVIKETGVVGEIQFLGTNYVVVEAKSERWRCWLDDVAKLNPADEPKYEKFNESKSMYADKPDWGTPESTKKAKKITPGEKIKEEDEMQAARQEIAKDKKQARDMIAQEKEKDRIKHAELLKKARAARARRMSEKNK